MATTAPTPQQLADRDVILRCREGDDDAYAILVSRYERRAYWVAYKLVGNPEDSRDIAQEAFIRVFRSIERFDIKRNFYTWLYQIVVNLCIDHLRWASGHRTRPIDDVGDVGGQAERPWERLEQAELRGRIFQVLEDLPPKDKLVIVLRDLEGLSAKEIAEVTGSTHATVRWRLHRARQLFRVAWEARFGAPEGAEKTAAKIQDAKAERARAKSEKST